MRWDCEHLDVLEQRKGFQNRFKGFGGRDEDDEERKRTNERERKAKEREKEVRKRKRIVPPVLISLGIIQRMK